MNMRGSILASILALAGGAGAAQASVGDLYMMTGSGSSPSSLWRVDKTSGAASLIGSTGLDHFTGIDFDPTTGTLYGHRNRSGAGELYTINPATGGVSFVGSTNIQSPDITFDNSGQMFAWAEFGSGAGDDMVKVNKGSGAVSLLGDSFVGTARTGLFTALDGTVYMKNYDASLYTMNTGSGSASYYGTISGVTSGDTNNPTDVDPTSGDMYMIDRSGGGGSTPSILYRTNLGSLTASSIGTIYDVGSGAAVTGVSGLAFEIPAPGSLALLGLGGLAVARRRRA